MVTSVTSLTGSGLRDWVVQRASAVILALYTLCLVGVLVKNHPISFDVWSELFKNGFFRAFTFLALLSLLYHSWVGIWTVLTDYVKCSCLRLLLMIVVVLALLSYLAWGVAIVWGLY